MLQLTSPTDPWAMGVVERFIVPTDVRHDFTHEQAVRAVVASFEAGAEFWLGDRERGVLVRAVWLNPYVVTPCIMGNGRQMRAVVRESLDWAFSATDIVNVVVWAQHPAICRIVQSLGAKQVACLPNSHFDGTGLRTTWAYSFERGQNGRDR